MFLHGSWMHLLGNMWFLWLFGNNIEDAMTRPRFLAFYLLCGLAAALAQVIAQPNSEIPMVGASGAISGVMGAYLVLFPRVRVFTLVPLGFFITSVALPAWVMLMYWMRSCKLPRRPDVDRRRRRAASRSGRTSADSSRASCSSSSSRGPIASPSTAHITGSREEWAGKNSVKAQRLKGCKAQEQRR